MEQRRVRSDVTCLSNCGRLDTLCMIEGVAFFGASVIAKFAHRSWGEDKSCINNRTFTLSLLPAFKRPSPLRRNPPSKALGQGGCQTVPGALNILRHWLLEKIEVYLYWLPQATYPLFMALRQQYGSLITSHSLAKAEQGACQVGLAEELFDNCSSGQARETQCDVRNRNSVGGLWTGWSFQK